MLILCEIDSNDNPLTLPQVYPLQNVVNGRTANKNVSSHNCLEIGTGSYASIKTSGVTGGA